MTADEMSKLKKDLSATRDRQTSQVRAKEGPARSEPIKPKIETPARRRQLSGRVTGTSWLPIARG